MIFSGPKVLRQSPGAAPDKGDPTAPHPRLAKLAARLRADFLTGVLVLLPLAVIGYVAWNAWQMINLTLRPIARSIIGPDGVIVTPVLAALTLLLLVLAVGFLAKGMAGRRITSRVHRTIERIPVVGTLVGAVRQVADTVLNKKEGNLKQTCLVEFPKEGHWCVGLISAKPQGELLEKLPKGADMVAVYIGLPPFASSFLVFVPRKDVILLDMKVEDEVKLLATAGIAYPPERD